MNIIGDLEREWDHLRHPETSTSVPTFTPHAPSQSSQPEVPMASALLTDAEKAASALVRHIGNLIGNPLVDAIVDAGLGMVLTPGETAAVVSFVQAIEADRAPAQPPADGSGPQQVTA
jgi:hypothetical protein